MCSGFPCFADCIYDLITKQGSFYVFCVRCEGFVSLALFMVCSKKLCCTWWVLLGEDKAQSMPMW
jgi:hypothetical protein